MNNPSACPHFSNCSGCELGKDFLNPPVWQEAVRFFGEVGIKAELVADGFEQKRFKAKLAVRAPGSVGLFKRNSHEVISIPNCLVHHASINQAVALLNRAICEQKFPLYDEKKRTGILRYVQFFVDRVTGKVQLSLVVDSAAEILRIPESSLWHSIWLNVNDASTNRIFGDEWKLVSGEPFLWQTLNQTKLAFHPGAFSQVHLPLFEKLLEKIETWVRPGDRLLELYAGVGAIGLSLRHKVKQALLVENNPYAHLSYRESVRHLSLDNYSYHLGEASEALFEESNLIVVDPPRKGLELFVLKKLAALYDHRLIYVSCNFESFRRDCEFLFQNGWKLKEASGYLLFPGTNHVEIVALFEKCSLFL